MSTLLPHQQRVVYEQQELQEKMHGLYLFFSSEIFKGLPREDQDLLRLQHNSMTTYYVILGMRINRF